MNLIEITQKNFNIPIDAVCLMESYTNPGSELSIEFTNIHSESTVNYYKAIVREQATNDGILLIFLC